MNGKGVLVIAASFGALILVGVCVGLIVYFTAPEDTAALPCTVPIDDVDRYDCYPEPGADQEKCEARGCCWRATVNDDKAPWCYYPEIYGYEVIREAKKSSLGYSVNLQWIEGIPYRYEHDVDRAIDKLSVEFEMQTDSRLRVKISALNEERFEVPIVLPEVTTKAENPLYDITYTDSPFSFQVQRKDTGTVIFDSSVGGLTFSNQFIQLSTKLPSNNVYGFGEHNHRQYRHNLDWKTWAIFTRDVAPVDEWNLYGAQPLHMCVENDSNAHAVLLMNSNAMDIVLQPAPGLTYRTIGGVLDFYIFLGPTPEDIVRQYTLEFTGTPMMPPYWSLGFQVSRWGYKSLDEVKGIVEDMRKHNVPQDVQYADIDYMDNYRDFTIDQEHWSGLGDFFEELHSYGQYGIIIKDPGISNTENVEYAPYETGKVMNVWINDTDGITPLEGEVWPGKVHYPDFTNPSTETWWTHHCLDFHNNVSFDALWIDMNEPSSFIPGSTTGCKDNSLNYPPYLPNILGGFMYDKTLCMDAVSNWGLQYDVHSLYGHSMSIASYQTMKTIFPTKRSMVLTRSQFVGTGHYAGHWLGDNQSLWEQIPWSIVGMLEYGLFGFPYIGADICGFWYNTTEEMCQRWHQLGAFYPFARNHNGDGMIPQHPTVWREPVIDNIRDILNHRYRLLPFLYTLFFDAYTKGSTVVRPFLHEFPGDVTCQSLDKQFLWGPSFMIAPVMEEGKTSVDVYFPNDRWYDYYTGEEIVETQRGTYVNVYAPIDFIPLYVRGGYIIPTQQPNTTTTTSRQNPFGLIVALGSDTEDNAEGAMFWDDGESRDTIDNGIYTLVSFSATKSYVNIVVTHNGYDGELVSLRWDDLSVYGLQDRPTEVLADGFPVSFEYDDDLKVLTVVDMGLVDITKDHSITWS